MSMYPAHAQLYHPQLCVSPQEVMLSTHNICGQHGYGRPVWGYSHPNQGYGAPQRSASRPLYCPTPQDILNDTIQSPRYWTLLPRTGLGRPSFEPITFTVRGISGPRLIDIQEDTVVLDGANDQIFARHGWIVTKCAIHWPGFDSTRVAEMVTLRDTSGAPMTRTALAKHLSAQINVFMQRACDSRHKSIRQRPGNKKWAIGQNNICFEHVRIISLKYYRTYWVPELLVSCRCL